jgi:hypothetical protein
MVPYGPRLRGRAGLRRRAAAPQSGARASSKPAAAKSAAYSSRVRSRPPGATSMFRSENRGRPLVRPAELLLDHEQRGVLAHGPPARPEDCLRLCVLPVVDYRLQDVGVPAARHALEEASRCDLAAVLDASFGEERGRIGDDMRLVEEHTADRPGTPRRSLRTPAGRCSRRSGCSRRGAPTRSSSRGARRTTPSRRASWARRSGAALPTPRARRPGSRPRGERRPRRARGEGGRARAAVSRLSRRDRRSCAARPRGGRRSRASRQRGSPATPGSRLSARGARPRGDHLN